MNHNLKKGVLAGLLAGVLGVGVVAGVVATNAGPGNLVEIENQAVPLDAEPEDAMNTANPLTSPYSIEIDGQEGNVVDLGDVIYNSPNAGKQVKFTLRDQQNDLYDTNEPYYLSPIAPMDNALYEVKLDKDTMEPGGFVTGTVTVKPHVKLEPGEHDFQTGWLPQLSSHRIANVMNIEANVVPAKLTINSIGPVNTHYGESINYEKVECNTDNGTYTMADLGFSVADDGANLEAGKGHTCKVDVAVSGSYEIINANNLNLTVNVAKTTPKVEWARAVGNYIESGKKLGTKEIEGSATNPYNKEAVKGTWSWRSPDEVVYNDNGYQKTLECPINFTPEDRDNYETPTDQSAKVTVKGGGSGGSSSSGVKADPEFKVANLGNSYTWDGKEHPAEVQKKGNGDVVVTYTKDTEDGEECGIPKDVGTYYVKVELAETGQYTGGLCSGTITIAPCRITFASADAVYSRPYNGNNVARVDVSHITVMGLPGTSKKPVTPDGDGGFTATSTTSGESQMAGVTVSCPSVTGAFEKADVGYNYKADIVLHDVKLSGPDADNCTVDPDVTLIEYNKAIMSRDVILSLYRSGNEAKTITKEYGQQLDLNTALKNGDVTAQFEKEQGIRGLVSTDSTIEGLTLYSSGVLPSAEVGETYNITAWGKGENYRIHVDTEIEVVPATPKPVEKDPSLQAKTSATLKDIPVPNVTFENPYTKEPVPGTVTWENEDTKIGAVGENQICTYSFVPTQLGCYKKVSGLEATVEPISGTPIPITMNDPGATYDGNAHGVNPNPSANGVSFDVTYRVSGGGDFDYSVPVAAGTYDYQVVATAPSSSEYETTTQTGSYVIGKAMPTGVPTVSGSGSGGKLSDFSLSTTGITGLNGEAVKGTVSWNEPSTTVLRGNVYDWTFTSSDPNYMSCTGKLAAIPFVTNRTPLIDRISAAENLLNSVKVSSNGSDISGNVRWTTQADRTKLEQAAEDAKAMRDNTGCTQAEFDAAVAKLNSAIDAFNTAATYGKQSSGGGGGSVSPAPSSSPAPAPSAPAAPAEDETTDGETPEEQTEQTPVVVEEHFYRLYNPATGEHLYTSQPSVMEAKMAEGWNNEVISGAPKLPAKSSTPVYQLDNPWTGEHHYTLDVNEYNTLKDMGWTPRDVVFYSADPATGMKVYRLFNPYAEGQGMGAAAHHYTYDSAELADLQSRGYTLDQNAGWFYLPKDAVQ